MDLGLAGRRALVTGAGSGIGAAIAERLAAEGAEVVVHSRTRGAAEARIEQVLAAGGRATAVHGDLTDPVATSDVLDQVLAAGPVEILVANAGPWAERTFEDAEDADWLATFEANVLSLVRCARALAPGMRDRGWGRIVSITTRGVLDPLPHMADLSAAKAAVANVSGGLAKHLAGSGITVNTVSPGVILTPGVRAMFTARAAEQGETRTFEELEPEVVATYAANPCGRLGRPDEVADAVAFLVSERAGYINGATLRVDGGLAGTINP